MLMATKMKRGATLAIWVVGAMVLAGCEQGFELASFNLRGADTAMKTAPRPEPDANGVISYPNYQMAVARSGDSVGDLALRVGLKPEELGRYNGLATDHTLREGELLALPRRVKGGGGRIDIASIASDAIDSADTPIPTGRSADTSPAEPIRHRVERGETAYSIARLYDVSVTALASWNGLGADLGLREGQQLLIPIVERRTAAVANSSRPGTGTTTPTPPSASKPLPEAVETATLPPSPDLG